MGVAMGNNEQNSTKLLWDCLVGPRGIFLICSLLAFLLAAANLVSVNTRNEEINKTRREIVERAVSLKLTKQCAPVFGDRPTSCFVTEPYVLRGDGYILAKTDGGKSVPVFDHQKWRSTFLVEGPWQEDLLGHLKAVNAELKGKGGTTTSERRAADALAAARRVAAGREI